MNKIPLILLAISQPLTPIQNNSYQQNFNYDAEFIQLYKNTKNTDKIDLQLYNSVSENYNVQGAQFRIYQSTANICLPQSNPDEYYSLSLIRIPINFSENLNYYDIYTDLYIRNTNGTSPVNGIIGHFQSTENIANTTTEVFSKTISQINNNFFPLGNPFSNIYRDLENTLNTAQTEWNINYNDVLKYMTMYAYSNILYYMPYYNKYTIDTNKITYSDAIFNDEYNGNNLITESVWTPSETRYQYITIFQMSNEPLIPTLKEIKFNFSVMTDPGTDEPIEDVPTIPNTGTTQEVVDIPTLLFKILSMPFAFISQAFNLTLFPGTPYEINIANLVLSFLGLALLVIVFFMIIKWGR